MEQGNDNEGKEYRPGMKATGDKGTAGQELRHARNDRDASLST